MHNKLVLGFLVFAAAFSGKSLASDYVTSRVCGECHREAYTVWQGSHHDLAMQEASAATVLGDFNNASFDYFGSPTRFFRRDAKFLVNTEGPDGKPHDYEIAYTFGVEPLQQYLIAFPGGRLQALSIAWDTHEKRWFHLYPAERIQAGDPLHWTGVYQNWNMMCGDCHSTDYQKNFDSTAQTYATRWSEIDVGCEACHGPGGQHVAWARAGDPGVRPESTNKGLIVDLAGESNRVQVEVCAQCHSRRTVLAGGHRPGKPLLDSFLPAALREGLYHADGQILDEVYVYGSFVQSKMYKAGVRCSDCHDSHSLKLKAQGNGVCTQCHRADPPARFPSLSKKRYDTSEHHFHPANSAGAQCVSCHMPAKNYMIVDPRRDHSLRVPRPDLSGQTGAPDACTGCHKDQSPAWAAQQIGKRAAGTPSGRPKPPHFGVALAAGRTGDARSQPALRALALDATQPLIARVTAAERIRPSGREGLQALVDLAFDDESWLRFAAIGPLESLPPEQRFPALAPLLNDEAALVRGEAARVLLDAPAERFNEQQSADFRRALADYRRVQEYMADSPSGQLNLGNLADKLNDSRSAEAHFRKALELDSHFLPARFNLANLLNGAGDNGAAVKVLQAGIERASDNGELYYSLGLLYAEMQLMSEAAEALGKAADLLNDRARVRYNYSLALQSLGRSVEAATELKKAYQIDSGDPDVVYALVVFHAQREQWSEALPYARRLVELAPNAPGPRDMLQEIQQRAAER